MSRQMAIGIAMLAVAAVAALIAIGVGYGSATRWIGLSAAEKARARMLHAPDQVAVRAAQDAAAALPDEPSAVLPSIDLTSAEDYARLEALERECESDHRELVRTAMALSLVLRDQPAPAVAGPDGPMLAALAALRAGGAPTRLPLAQDQAPRHAVLAATLAAQWRSAIAAGDRALAREAAGALAMLAPRHPDAPSLWFAAAALDPASDRQRLVTMAQRLPQAQLPALTRTLARLAPDRSGEIDAIALGLGPNLTPAQMLEAQVKAAVAGAPVQVAALARRCVDAGRADLAKQLLPRLPATAQPAFRRFVLMSEGDLAELAKAGEQAPELLPRATPPRVRPGSVAFHLSNAAGVVPRSPVTVRLNGRPIEAARITRLGSLVIIDTQKEVGPTDLEVRAGEHSIYATKVVL